jgi:hypothetical protein
VFAAGAAGAAAGAAAAGAAELEPIAMPVDIPLETVEKDAAAAPPIIAPAIAHRTRNRFILCTPFLMVDTD